MKKSYADICLERAEKATKSDWVETGRNEHIAFGYFKPNMDEFISHALFDISELSRRLKRACEALRDVGHQYRGIAIELESMPEGEK